MPSDTDPAADSTYRAVVIGIGNPYRSDDGFGISVTRSLRGRTPADVDVIDEEGDAAAIMEAWRGYDMVVVVDALAGGGQPGRVHRLDPLAGPLPREFFRYSTHAVGVGEAVELARALGCLPQRMVILGVEGECFEAGTTMSPVVSAAVDSVAARVLDELSRP